METLNTEQPLWHKGDGHTHRIDPIPNQVPDEWWQGNDLRIWDRVRKATGYSFPGTVVAVYKTLGQEDRYVVEMEYFGLQHIFNRKQLSRATEEEIYLDIARALPSEYLNPNLIEKL
jgi:hypothetical protein